MVTLPLFSIIIIFLSLDLTTFQFQNEPFDSQQFPNETVNYIFHKGLLSLYKELSIHVKINKIVENSWENSQANNVKENPRENSNENSRENSCISLELFRTSDESPINSKIVQQCNGLVILLHLPTSVAIDNHVFDVSYVDHNVTLLFKKIDENIKDIGWEVINFPAGEPFVETNKIDVSNSQIFEFLDGKLIENSQKILKNIILRFTNLFILLCK